MLAKFIRFTSSLETKNLKVHRKKKNHLRNKNQLWLDLKAQRKYPQRRLQIQDQTVLQGTQCWKENKHKSQWINCKEKYKRCRPWNMKVLKLWSIWQQFIGFEFFIYFFFVNTFIGINSYKISSEKTINKLMKWKNRIVK